MKRLYIAILIALSVAAAVVAGIQYDPGYILVAFGGYTLETSFWVGAALLILLLALVFAALQLLRRSIGAGAAVGKLLSSRRHRRSQRQTSRGMIAYVEGNWSRAQKLLSAGAEDTDVPLINYLMAARASHALGDQQQVRRYLGRAERSTSGASIAVDLTQAELYLQSGKLEECLATLTRARSSAQKNPTVLKLLKDVYIGLRDWEQLQALLPELAKNKLIDDDERARLALRCAMGQLENLRERMRGEQLCAQLKQWWQQLPKELSRHSAVVASYARELLRCGEQQAAERVLRAQLRLDWHRELVELYGLVEGGDNRKQLLLAESWLKERNNDSTLLLTLGRICLRDQLWGKAREYFEGSYRLERSPEVCAELGRLLSTLGEHEKSNAYFQEGLSLSTALAPSPAPALIEPPVAKSGS